VGPTRRDDEIVVKPEPTTRLDDGPVIPPLDRAKRDAMRAPRTTRPTTFVLCSPRTPRSSLRSKRH
jgi:hypothetical protein